MKAIQHHSLAGLFQLLVWGQGGIPPWQQPHQQHLGLGLQAQQVVCYGAGFPRCVVDCSTDATVILRSHMHVWDTTLHLWDLLHA